MTLAAIPDGDRRRKDPLPGDAPVQFHRISPVVESNPHVRRYPLDLACRSLDLFWVNAHKPLPLREDLNGRLAPPAQAHVLLQRLLLEDDAPALHIVDNFLLGIGNAASAVRPSDSGHLSFPVYGLAERKMMLHPPPHVLLITKRADHDDACAKLRVHHRICQDGNLIIENRHTNCFTDVFAVALILWIDSYSHAGGQKLGP
ncbi:Uncharacterised protein [uncultured archaeon]|nr:Uncharacterised protein [uncultured archaeon]